MNINRQYYVFKVKTSLELPDEMDGSREQAKKNVSPYVRKGSRKFDQFLRTAWRCRIIKSKSM
jgi:hypothetical protein